MMCLLPWQRGFAEGNEQGSRDEEIRLNYLCGLSMITRTIRRKGWQEDRCSDDTRTQPLLVACEAAGVSKPRMQSVSRGRWGQGDAFCLSATPLRSTFLQHLNISPGRVSLDCGPWDPLENKHALFAATVVFWRRVVTAYRGRQHSVL